MLIAVYRFSGHCTRSIACAYLVTYVEVDELPDDQIAFAEENGGDFIEIAER